MPLSDAPGEPAGDSFLANGDPLAVELIGVIQHGDLDALRRLLGAHAGLASVRMIGLNCMAGGWRTPLHAAAATSGPTRRTCGWRSAG